MVRPPRHWSLAVALAVCWLAWLSVLYVRLGEQPFDLVRALPLGRRLLGGLTLLVAVSLCAGAIRSPNVKRYFGQGLLALAGVVIAAILIRGRVLGAVSTVVWLVMLACVSGQWLLDRLFRGNAGPRGTDRIVFALALALGLASHMVLAVSLIGVLYRWPIVLALIALSAIQWRALADLARALPRLGRQALAFASAPSWYALPLVTVLTVWFLFIFIQAVAPETQYDAIAYHLALPRIYIEHHRLISTPYHPQSWFYQGAVMNFLLAMLIGGPVAAKLLHFVFLLITVGAIAAFARRMGGRMAGLHAAVLYATLPLIAWEASTAYADLALAAYCFLAVMAAHAWMRRRDVAWLWVAGVMAGFAISVKVSALYLMLPLGVAIVVVELWEDGSRRARRALASFAFVAGTIIGGFPWPTLRWVQTGNPTFPFYNELFRSPLWPAGAAPPLLTNFGMGDAIGDLAQLPWNLSFNTNRFHEGAAAGVIGLGLLVLPLLVLRRPSRTGLLLMALLVPFSLFWIYSGHQYLRFAIPALPLVYVLAGYALGGLPRGVSAAFLLVWVAASLFLALPLFSVIPERLPLGVAFGFESPRAYRVRILPTYNAYRAIERRHPGERVHTLAFSDELRFYAPGVLEPIWSTVLPTLQHDEQALTALRAHGVNHLLVNWPNVPPSHAASFLLQPAFLSRHELEFSARGIEVYHLNYPVP